VCTHGYKYIVFFVGVEIDKYVEIIEFVRKVTLSPSHFYSFFRGEKNIMFFDIITTTK